MIRRSCFCPVVAFGTQLHPDAPLPTPEARGVIR